MEHRKSPIAESIQGHHRLWVIANSTHAERYCEYLRECFSSSVLLVDVVEESARAAIVRIRFVSEGIDLQHSYRILLSPFASARFALRTCLPAQLCNVKTLQEAADICLRKADGISSRLNVWPTEKTREIGELLISIGIALHPKHFSHVISIICHDDGSCDIGFNRRQDVFDVMNEQPSGVSSICRAEHKLEELAYRSTDFSSCLGSAIEGSSLRALDIGASPGGWTDFLALHPFISVNACDPGELDRELLQKPNVCHQQCRVEHVNWEKLKDEFAPPFGLVVCDMNGMDARDLIRLLLTLVHLMTPSSLLVVTLKLPKNPSASQVLKQVTESQAILNESGLFEIIKTVWLLANRNNERTLLARRVVRLE